MAGEIALGMGLQGYHHTQNSPGHILDQIKQTPKRDLETLRKGFKFNNAISCQRLDVKTKVIFIYIIDKQKVNPSRRELAIKRIEEKLRQKK